MANPSRAKHWSGLRQDSGDPYVYAPRAKEIYTSLGIDHRTKTIIFSDALNMDKALGLKKQADELGFIGTSALANATNLLKRKLCSCVWDRNVLDERFHVNYKWTQREK